MREGGVQWESDVVVVRSTIRARTESSLNHLIQY